MLASEKPSCVALINNKPVYIRQCFADELVYPYYKTNKNCFPPGIGNSKLLGIYLVKHVETTTYECDPDKLDCKCVCLPTDTADECIFIPISHTFVPHPDHNSSHYVQV